MYGGGIHLRYNLNFLKQTYIKNSRMLEHYIYFKHSEKGRYSNSSAIYEVMSCAKIAHMLTDLLTNKRKIQQGLKPHIHNQTS